MIEFQVNGRAVRFDGDEDTPLLWVLRDELGLTGSKYACGAGLCGACAVHVDGRPGRSCVVAVKAVAGKAVTTIEGLSPDGSHPVQRAWVEQDVAQCGYCQAGQIMEAAALLERTPEPSDADIDAHITAVCRCGTYQRIRKAIHHAARLMREEA